MKNRRYVERIDNIISNLEKLKTDISSADKAELRIGDVGTPYSIKKVIEDEEHKTVVIIWEDGSVTKYKTPSDIQYDFTTSFGLCIAERLTNDLSSFATAIKNSKTRYFKPKQSEEKE